MTKFIKFISLSRLDDTQKDRTLKLFCYLRSIRRRNAVVRDITERFNNQKDTVVPELQSAKLFSLLKEAMTISFQIESLRINFLSALETYAKLNELERLTISNDNLLLTMSEAELDELDK